jgi:hypothetical protein
MKRQKMSLANIQGKLSRTEMKKIMAGSEAGCSAQCLDTESCTRSDNSTGKCHMPSEGPNAGHCFCNSVS